MGNYNGTHKIKSVQKSNIITTDGLIFGTAWDGNPLTYSFPTSSYVYNSTVSPSYPVYEEAKIFTPFSTQQKNAVFFALDKDIGPAASAGFSVEGFTNINFQYDSSADTDTVEALRFGNTGPAQNGNSFAGHAWYPGYGGPAGDVWINNHTDKNAVAGSAQWSVILHEIGHALGLKHTFKAEGQFPVLPSAYDGGNYTVMSYKANTYSSSSAGYYTGGHPQTFMMLDIEALQYLYGANYTVNSGDTVYKWTPNSGNTYVNGAVGINAVSNVINATIWDGGGIDTYDLSAYTTSLNIDLRSGFGSKFSSTQSAKFTDGTEARANIYNAKLYKNDKRSLIENATGGSGNDTIRGNEANNKLLGNAGNDTLYGEAGNDTIFGGSGRDIIYGGDGDDWTGATLGSNSYFYGGNGSDAVTYYGAATGQKIDLRIARQANGDYFSSIERVNGSNKGNDHMTGNNYDNTFWGQGGNDTLIGGYGNDKLYGGKGKDTLHGDAGNDTLFGGNYSDGDGDIIYGGDGDDWMGGSIRSTFYGGNGYNDAITYYGSAGGVKIDLRTTTQTNGDKIYSVERINGSNYGADQLIGNSAANTFWGNGGNDWLYGYDGADKFYGGEGNDYIYGGNGDDRLNGGNGDDFLYGGNNNDTLYGGAGLNRFYGEAGDDWMGATSRSYFYGGSGYDTVTYYGAAAGVTIDLNRISQTNGDYLSSIERIYGSDKAADKLTGNYLDNKLWGNGGNDNLIGNGGNDVLIGGNGNDIINGGTGNDALYGGAGDDVFIFTGRDNVDSIHDLQTGRGATGHDRIQIASTTYDSYADIQNVMSQSGANVLINFGGGHSVTLNNTQLANMTEDMFDFV